MWGLPRPASTMDGRFSFKTLHDYVNKKEYPSEFSKDKKRSLKKRAEYFERADGQLYYPGSACSMRNLGSKLCLGYIS